jgi:hypothetical protein
MKEGMCQFKYSPKEIKYSSENKATLFFLDIFVYTFVFNSCYA